jgi:hypothetical protein
LQKKVILVYIFHTQHAWQNAPYKLIWGEHTYCVIFYSL